MSYKVAGMLMAGLALLAVGAVAWLWVAVSINNCNEPAQVVCTEDMDCWNCQAMGNRVCGPLGDND